MTFMVIRIFYRFISGRPMNGQRKTDSTFRRPGTRSLDPSGTALRWEMLPGYQRLLWRIGGCYLAFLLTILLLLSGVGRIFPLPVAMSPRFLLLAHVAAGCVAGSSYALRRYVRDYGYVLRLPVYRRINPQIDGVITSTFAGFDPLGQAAAGMAGDAAAPDLNALYKEKVLTALNAAVGNDIEIRSLAFAKPTYDKATEAAIATYGQKRLDARNLAEDLANAKTRKEIAAAGSEAIQVRCLEIAEKTGKEPGLCLGASVALTKPVG